MDIIRFCILVGSARTGGNGPGISKWINNELVEVLSSYSSNVFMPSTIIIDPHTKPHPVNPVLSDTSPAAVKDSAYDSQEVRDWSQLIQSCSAMTIVTPEYNAGYPSTLKNALDVLYSEWQHKPVAVVSYGGHGGSKSDAQLRQVLTALRMNIVEQKVQITLPREYLSGNRRVAGSEYYDTFLNQCKGTLHMALTQLIDKVLPSKEMYRW